MELLCFIKEEQGLESVLNVTIVENLRLAIRTRSSKLHMAIALAAARAQHHPQRLSNWCYFRGTRLPQRQASQRNRHCGDRGLHSFLSSAGMLRPARPARTTPGNDRLQQHRDGSVRKLRASTSHLFHKLTRAA